MASLRVALLAVIIYLCFIVWGLLDPIIGTGPGAAVAILIFYIIDGKLNGKSPAS